MDKYTILITNDDGIDAEGIYSLWTSLKNYDAEIYVVAPAAQQSGMGLATSMTRPLTLRKHLWDSSTVYSVDGTPADCVKVGIGVVLNKKPDLVLSGINSGTNHGRTVLYSGTVGGAIEAALRHIPGIAFSAYDVENAEFQPFTSFVPKIIDYIRKTPLPQGTLLNVSFPPVRFLTEGEPLSIRLTKQGRQCWFENPELENTLSHDSRVHLNAALSTVADEDIESDTIWLNKGFITCSPVHVGDLTDRQFFSEKKEHFERFFV